MTKEETTAKSPFATSEQLTGERKWVFCSNCGIGLKRRVCGMNPNGTEYVEEYIYSYCPYCGAEVEEGDEE